MLAHMRPWPLVALLACVPYDALPVAPPSDPDAMTCHLAAAFEGKLSYPGITDLAKLECTATNRASATREICAQPYVGVRQTGALYTAHEPVCSSELEPGASEELVAQLDLRRELCQLQRGGCIVHAFTLRGDHTPDAASVIAFARGLEATAPAAGRDRPALRECDALVEAWRNDPAFAPYRPFLTGDPDEVRRSCIGVSRATFACMSAARTSADADRCAP